MATYLELQTIIDRIVQDDSLSSLIPEYINQAISEIAGGMQSALGDWITPPLPNLLTIGSITTDITLPYVTLPDDFHRNVQFVARSNGVEIDIAESFISFVETYPALDRVGTITEVSVQGNLLYYQSIPTEAEDLIVHYYKFPTALTGVTDVPDYIPNHLQIPLITNHVAWKLYELIEDGLEGPGLNTQRYMGIFYGHLKTLELTIPYMRRGINLLSDN